MTPLAIFALCVIWEALAISYTRTAARASRNLRGYASVFVIGTVMALLGILSIGLTVTDPTPANVTAWALGSGVGAVIGLAIGRA